MGTYDIAVTLDNENHTYRGGSTIHCAFKITAHENESIKNIRVEQRYRTHGTGKDMYDEIYKINTISEQMEISEGQIIHLETTFEAPTHPLTYTGIEVNLEHYFRVIINPSMGFDSTTEQVYTVTPGKVPADLVPQNESTTETNTIPEVDITEAAPEPLWKKVLGWIGTIIFVGLIIFGVIANAVPIAIGVGLGLLIRVIMWIRKKMLRKRLGFVHVKMPDGNVFAGQEVPVRLRFTPRKSCKIRSIEMEFRGAEVTYQIPWPWRWFSRSGEIKDITYHYAHGKRLAIPHWVHREKVELSGMAVLQKGQEYIFETTVTMPEKDTYTYGGLKHTYWDFGIRIDIPWFPDWTRHLSLCFFPKEFYVPKIENNLETSDSE